MYAWSQACLGSLLVAPCYFPPCSLSLARFSLLVVPCSLHLASCSLIVSPWSLLLLPCSLLLAPCSSLILAPCFWLLATCSFVHCSLILAPCILLILLLVLDPCSLYLARCSLLIVSCLLLVGSCSMLHACVAVCRARCVRGVRLRSRCLRNMMPGCFIASCIHASECASRARSARVRSIIGGPEQGSSHCSRLSLGVGSVRGPGPVVYVTYSRL